MFLLLDHKLIFGWSFLIALILSSILILITFFLTITNETFEKNSSYECGFSPFGDSRLKFEIKYYLVGILYIIFDLELVFLLPWILFHFNINWFGFFILLIFLNILTLGFIYEWYKGALQWN